MTISYLDVAGWATRDPQETKRPRHSAAVDPPGSLSCWDPQDPDGTAKRPWVQQRANRLHSLTRHQVVTDDISDQVIRDVELRAGFRLLGRTDRVLLYLHYVDGVSVAELSALFNASNNAVHQRLVRARDSLRRLVDVGIGRMLRRRWQARRRNGNA